MGIEWELKIQNSKCKNGSANHVTLEAFQYRTALLSEFRIWNSEFRLQPAVGTRSVELERMADVGKAGALLQRLLDTRKVADIERGGAAACGAGDLVAVLAGADAVAPAVVLLVDPDHQRAALQRVE